MFGALLFVILLSAPLSSQATDPIVKVVYSAGKGAQEWNDGIITASPGVDYHVKMEVLRNDLAHYDLEKVIDVTLNGKSIGGCNPDGGDYDCTFFHCPTPLNWKVTAPASGLIPVRMRYTGHSWDCDCDMNDWTCSKESTVPNRTPMTAVARFTLTRVSGQESYTCPAGTTGQDLTVSWYSDGKIKNYEDMQASCSSKNSRICSYTELCPAGQGNAPVGGQQVSENMWAPVLDDNTENWVQVGNAHAAQGGMCTKVTVLHPLNSDVGSWWNARDGGVTWKRIYSCCEGGEKPSILVTTTSTETTIPAGTRCSKPVTIANANIHGEATIGVNQEYVVMCNQGFALPPSISNVLTCSEHGTLSNLGKIKCKSCISNTYSGGFNGFSKALNGYNFRQGDPFAQIDPGFRGAIFDGTAKDTDGCDMGSKAPGFTVDRELSCQTDLSVTVHRSFNSLSQKLEEETSKSGGIQIGVEMDVTLEASIGVEKGPVSASAGGSVSFKVPPPFKSGWSESTSMQQARKFFGKSAGSIAIAKASCSLWSVRQDSISKPMLSATFKDALQYLNDHNHKSCAEQQTAFRKFMKNYGTHYFQTVIFGASYATYTEFSERASSMLNDNALKACSAESSSWQLGIAIGGSSASNGCNAEATSALNGISNGRTTRYQVTRGSKPAANTANWAQMAFTPVPIHFTLAPIVNVLSDRNLGSQIGLKVDGSRLRNWVIPMYWNYCKTMGISCEAGCDIAYCAECNTGGLTCKRCQASHAGDGTETCKKTVCGIPSIANAIVAPQKMEYPLGEKVSISCHNSHKLTGTSVLTCGQNNQWSATPTCEEKFACVGGTKSGTYIDDSLLCDGNNDCGDCSDESKSCSKPCKTWMYNRHQLECRNTGKIISTDKMCDGVNDCGDCTDEDCTDSSAIGCKIKCQHGIGGEHAGNKGDSSYCDYCDYGMGDCDYDSECRSDDCGNNNCRMQTGTLRDQFAWDDDCCQ